MTSCSSSHRSAPRSRCASPATGLCERSAGGPAPDVRYITRIVAVGCDTVRMRRGRIIRNGGWKPAAPSAAAAVRTGCTLNRSPPGHVYLAGDNRASSDDSRFWGALPVAQLLGRYVRTSSRGDRSGARNTRVAVTR